MSVRPVNPADKSVLAAWIANDPVHAGVMTPDFFMDDKDAQCLVFEDASGPAMYIRLDPASPTKVRAYVQFPDSRHNAISLTRAFQIVKDTLKKAGFNQLVFDSVSPSLIRFCKRRLGFVAAGGNDYLATF